MDRSIFLARFLGHIRRGCARHADNLGTYETHGRGGAAPGHPVLSVGLTVASLLASQSSTCTIDGEWTGG